MGFNSLEQLIAAFCGIKELDEQQLNKTKQLLEDLKNGMEDK